MYDVVLAILSVYGLSILISEYDGPYGALIDLRSHLTAFQCAVCTSIWIAIPVSILFGVGIAGYIATIGGSILLIRIDEVIQ